MPTNMGLWAKLAAPCDRLCINSAQSGAESGAESRTEQKATFAESLENTDMLVDAGACGTTREFLLAPRGSEPSPLTTPKTPIPAKRGTESGTPGVQKTPSDPELALIVERWAGLPEHIRQALLALVRDGSGDDLRRCV